MMIMKIGDDDELTRIESNYRIMISMKMMEELGDYQCDKDDDDDDDVDDGDDDDDDDDDDDS